MQDKNYGYQETADKVLLIKKEIKQKNYYLEKSVN